MDVFPLETGGFPLLCHYVGLREGLQPQLLHGSNWGNWVFSGSMTIEVLFSLFFLGERNVVELESSWFILHKPWTVEFRIFSYPVLSGKEVSKNIKHDHLPIFKNIFKLRMVNHLSLLSPTSKSVYKPWSIFLPLNGRQCLHVPPRRNEHCKIRNRERIEISFEQNAFLSHPRHSETLGNRILTVLKTTNIAFHPLS